jgi:hypothetical protein
MGAMSEIDYVVVDHFRLIDIIKRCEFLGLPHTYYLKGRAELSSARRAMMIGKAPVVVSYFVQEDNLAFWIGERVQDESAAIFWTGRRPDWVTTSEDLVELVATKLIEHLTERFEEEDE